MSVWVLIIFAHVGPMGDGNSNALTTVSGFTSREACLAGGRVAKEMASGTVKNIDYRCVSLDGRKP